MGDTSRLLASPRHTTCMARNGFRHLRLAVPALLTCALLGCATSKDENAPRIGVRNAHAMAYDGNRRQVILFGGADDVQVRGDTWAWDGERWNPLTAIGPEPRTFPAMTYDSLRKRVVLFGGNRVLFGESPEDSRFLGDTWEWNGFQWTKVAGSGPPPRAEAAMAFDSVRGKVVLFGGYDRVGGQTHRLGDTWEWDGSRWLEMDVAGPSPRNGAAQVYDEPLGEVVLFGGATSEGVSAETWEWDGQRWRQLQVAPTEGRFNSVMTYDPGSGTVVRFGGRFGGQPKGDTWEFDGRNWTPLSSTGPEARNHSAMAFDRKRTKVVLFGGHNFGVREDGTDVFGDTWEWSSAGWVRIAGGEPKPRVDNGH